MVKNEYAFNHFVHNLVDFISHEAMAPINYGRYLAMPMQITDLKEFVYISKVYL